VAKLVRLIAVVGFALVIQDGVPPTGATPNIPDIDALIDDSGSAVATPPAQQKQGSPRYEPSW
jgi:hypothetical protein